MKNTKLDIVIAKSLDDILEIIELRKKVFVEEQGIPENKEFDGNDFCGTHIIAKDNGRLVGSMRIRYFGDFVKFERMAVLAEYRKNNISKQIMQEGIKFVREKGFTTIKSLCQTKLLPLWEKAGYHEIKDAEKVKQNGMELVQIAYDIPKDPYAIQLNDHPAITNAPEGTWNKRERADKNPTISHIIESLKQRTQSAQM